MTDRYFNSVDFAGSDGGAGFTLGPAQNVFTGSDRAAAEAARNTFLADNPSWLATYNADTSLNIRLEFTEGTTAVAVYQVRNDAGNGWLDNESFEALRGAPGEDGSGTDFGGVSSNHIPAIDEDGRPYDSGIDVTETSLVTPKDLQVGLGTILLGQSASPVHSFSSAGENIVFGNRVSNRPFTPGGWSDGSAGEDWASYHRKGGTYHAADVIQAIDSDQLTNPSFPTTLGTNRRDYRIGIKAVSAQSKCYAVIKQSGIAIFESKRQSLTVGDNSFDLSVVNGSQGFFDLIGSVQYTVEFLSEDGDIVLLGDGVTGTPYLELDWQEWEDIRQPDQDDIDNLLSPTWGAVDSSDPNIIYGGFKQTGRIRKRELSAGDDTWFQSSINLPVPSEAAWSDWQSRESLIYGDL
ncbi:hypothetical protein NVP1232O_30 [Vibrio phage 1.232.O._10N.261.51.E11]|nr:hypothetical protein NVP1232O_30 [Vibrio phage 1.232.O._10N.261.51.E11]